MTTAFHRMRQLLVRWSGDLGTFVDGHDVLDRSTFRWRGEPIDGRRRALWLLAAHGHEVDLLFRSGTVAYQLDLRRGELRRPPVCGTDTVPASGLAFSELTPAERTDADEARDVEDWYTLLRVLAVVPCDATIRLCNRPGPADERWIRRAAALPSAPGPDHWLPFVKSLMRSGDRPVRLRVEDAESDCLVGPGIVVFGPSAVCESPDFPNWSADLSTGREYAASRLVDNRSGITEPPAVIVSVGSSSAEQLWPFGLWLRQTAHALTWVWLATEMHIDKSGAVKVRFDELEFLSVDAALTAFDTRDEAVKEIVDLWRLAVGNNDRLRRDAVLGALSMLAPTTTPLNKVRPAEVASRAFRLLHLAEKGRLGEATAALRSAQLAGFTTARSIGDGTRAAARSAMERVFIQVIAATGIIFAQANNAFAPEVALLLLLGVLAVTFGISAVAFRYEYPAAETLHSAFVADLQIQSRYLPAADLEAVEDMEALNSSMATLDRSMRWVEYVVVAGAAFSMVGIVAMGWLWLGSAGLAVGLVFAALFSIVAWVWRPRITVRFDGHCPVSLANDDRQVLGNQAFITTHGCHRYAMVDHKAQIEFAKDSKRIVRLAKNSWKHGPVPEPSKRHSVGS